MAEILPTPFGIDPLLVANLVALCFAVSGSALVGYFAGERADRTHRIRGWEATAVKALASLLAVTGTAALVVTILNR